MSYHRRRTLAIWIGVSLVFLPIFLGPIALIIVRARPEERLFYAIPLLIPFVFVLAVILLAKSERTVNPSLVLPGRVAFATRNLPGAIIYLESFLIPDAQFARGRTFAIVADGEGISYFTAGKHPIQFVHIPWPEIADVTELSGEFCITLADGNLLLHVPGGLLPMGARRVRVLAEQVLSRRLLVE